MAREAGVTDRVTFEVAPATAYPGKGYDLVAIFDCLHDMGDPVGAAGHVVETLADDGTWMIVEPFAGDRVRGQPESGRAGLLRLLDPDLRAGVAVPGSGTRPRRPGRRNAPARRGPQGGFTRFRRATETPFNLVFEARP